MDDMLYNGQLLDELWGFHELGIEPGQLRWPLPHSQLQSFQIDSPSDERIWSELRQPRAVNPQKTGKVASKGKLHPEGGAQTPDANTVENI